MTSLLAFRLADTCDLIPTTTAAKLAPTTAIEFDFPVLLLRKERDVQIYTVDEFPVGGPAWDGRAFRLTKDSTGEHYSCFVARNGQDHLCECRGFEAHGHCRHVDALKRLIDTGRLDHPEADRPVEPWPSPEQLAAEAGVALPF
jgi:hypothetical protein